ncbi:ABC transporter permease [Paraburkholderia caballeronis]|uniref:Autoinducer 2 import system permease protein LsrC n=1 Tax=Paraburkholderia caballeronis TaxID=416943 RepID=A0A1H7IUS2_9BURK|nr:ABC transporter permease [Paraburkholderia caballeronis]PXW27684.1 monosaccharide ABC transporter membrane protein (CUT2 family) [Paraburkholderia caballeronis]PXX03158.1 monosaccharide ABC transporter membrane protein (CUT2 family) [Paraburkholderia caballeronis]RAK03883.1 monosaccharide ABC transporter membrane protein (CUT2 family) [Paraburkholderia caballeronis]SEC13761.1 monosaccharide ABC transporter membrane protein, CUT2 family [Paraburkholderia caballeronis]SEK66156.1 monosaccharid
MMRHTTTPPNGLHPVHATRRLRGAGGLAAALAKSRETTLFVVLLLIVGGTALARPQFLNLQNLRDVLLNVSIVSLLTAGMTIVILMRHIDLSVGSTVGVSAYAVGSLYVAFPQMPVVVALAAGVAIGVAAGAINALLVALGRVPSLVATLSTLYIFRGADYAWVHGGQINATSLPDAFSRLATGALSGIPTLALIAVVLLVGLSAYLKRFRGGREFYAIGSNPEAARLAGIRVERRVSAGFLISGAIAGFAGALWLARFGTVDASTAKGIELQVVAAAVVGSVAITGGVGTILGATLGALVLGVISIALVVLHVSPFWEQAIEGALIVAAIAADTLLARSVAKRMTRKRDHG